MSFIPNSPKIRRQMLNEIGVSDFETLLDSVPASLRLNRLLNLPKALSEYELEKELSSLALKNFQTGAIFAGGGAYDHFSPAAVDQILLRPEFFTAYTPYQAEVAQGTLQAIYEFQTFICRLTGMSITNASMYDAATAMAEAVLMAMSHSGRKHILISQGVNPNYIETIHSYLAGQNCKIEEIPLSDGITDYDRFREKLSDKTAAVVIQSPNFLGLIEKSSDFSREIKDKRALFIAAYDPISLGILAPPGEFGADIAVAEGQSLGLPLNFGGPYLGLLSCRTEFLRKIPGRLSGRTRDKNNNSGFVLTLQTREQHIKRDRATSNICTNQALCALAATVYMSLLGKMGLERIGRLCLSKAHYAANKITEIPGFSLKFKGPYFKEFVVQTPIPPGRLMEKLQKKGIIAGIDLGKYKMGYKGCLMVAVTEKRTKEQIDNLAYELSKAV